MTPAESLRVYTSMAATKKYTYTQTFDPQLRIQASVYQRDASLSLLRPIQSSGNFR